MINEADVMASGRGVTSVVLRVHFRCRISVIGTVSQEGGEERKSEMEPCSIV